MYSKDFRIRHLLAIFFAIGIAEETSALLNMTIPFLSLVYTTCILVVVINFTNLKKYLWPPGLGIVGIFALIYLLFSLIGYWSGFFRDLSSIISIVVWIRCIAYLGEENTDDNDYYDIIENE